MPSRRRLLGAVGAGLAAASLPFAVGAQSGASGTDAWPMARHDPAGTGHAPDASGPKDGAELAWTHDAPDWFIGTSEPTLSGGTLYAAGRGILALDPASGKRRFAADGPYGSSPARTSTDVYATDTLAVTSTAGTFGVNADGGLDFPLLDGAGTERWGSGARSGGGFFTPSEAVTPVSAGGTVVTPTADRESLLAVDADNGAVRWRARIREDGVGANFQRPAVRDGVVYATAWPGWAAAYDLATGERLWRRKLDEQMVMAPVATPEGVVVLTRRTVQLHDPDDGERAWRYEHGGNVTESDLAVADGTVFAPTNGESIHAVDLASGEAVWSAPFADEGTPVVADGVVYAVRSQYELVALDAASGERRFAYEPEAVPLSAPAVANGQLYAANRRRVIALGEP